MHFSHVLHFPLMQKRTTGLFLLHCISPTFTTFTPPPPPLHVGISGPHMQCATMTFSGAILLPFYFLHSLVLQSLVLLYKFHPDNKTLHLIKKTSSTYILCKLKYRVPQYVRSNKLLWSCLPQISEFGSPTYNDEHVSQERNHQTVSKPNLVYYVYLTVERSELFEKGDKLKTYYKSV